MKYWKGFFFFLNAVFFQNVMHYHTQSNPIMTTQNPVKSFNCSTQQQYCSNKHQHKHTTIPKTSGPTAMPTSMHKLYAPAQSCFSLAGTRRLCLVCPGSHQTVPPSCETSSLLPAFHAAAETCSNKTVTLGNGTRWGNFWKAGWSAYGISQANRYHLKLNWTELS